MSSQLDTQGVSVVLRGNFNPAIFHPSWFASQDLIRRQEAEAASVEIVHAEAAIFNADWLQIHVFRDRFQARTFQEPYYEALRDLVIGVFSYLNHTPIRIMGINRLFHFRLESEEVWHKVGDRLAPKQDWVELLEGRPRAFEFINARKEA